ncbi:MAG: translocation/assembly module TamB domain-containing protein [Holophagaceae bacterium]|uniref:Translocation/assembly module TamB domain-containing protein n=1 Tax=Candidatus Geothrix skivensis TaxID=2954439 RepID=A0A9D7XHJ4_9BACT|nr:translocation/assembly module TamB domain-containing protein [Candidatus Geothrix skivensis]
MWHPTKEAVQRLWGRRWVRRISYAVVAGATVYTAGPWLLTRPVVTRWALGRLSVLVWEETGLPLAIGQVQLSATQGTLVLLDVRLGEDLLTVKRIEIQSDFLSLLGATHRIHSIRMQQPRLRLTEAGLAAIRLKSRPPRTGPLPQFRLDLLSLTDGEVQVPVALRGIPELRYQFSLKGTGPGPNRLRFDLAGPRLSVNGPGGWENGRLDLNGEASEQALLLKEAYLRLGDSQLRLKGRFDPGQSPRPERVEAQLSGIVDLAQASRWGGSPRPPLAGLLDLEGSLQGTLARPAWSFAAHGQDLRPGQATFLPGSLELKAQGGLDHVQVDRLHWSSSQGDLTAQGRWSGKTPIQASAKGSNLDVEALGRLLRLGEFQGVRASLEAELRGPAPAKDLQRLDLWKGSLKVDLAQHGLAAGGLSARLDQGRGVLDYLKLDLESLKLEGAGQATLGPGGPVHMEGEGRVEVGADQVADALRAWQVVDLDMEGQSTAQAEVRWSRRSGLELDGTVDVDRPRWHGARADGLTAKTVEIRGSELRVKQIEVRKDQGRGGGDLWLTWAKTPPGQAQMDMCYTAFQLPVTEGLRAADLKDDQGRDLPLTGSGSGWVRLQGPFDHIVMNGSAQAESSEVYGIKIPAVSTDFWMDLEARHLKLTDLRVAERPDLLGRGEQAPEGALALLGRADMDFRRWTWWVDLKGRLDSQLLALPGPRFQSQIEAQLLGPITQPFGDLELPEGKVLLSRGRVFFGNRSLDALEGRASLDQGRLEARLGLEGMKLPLLELRAHPEGPDLMGGLSLNISPDSAQSELLARSLTDDLIEDLSLSAQAQGRWTHGSELRWTGSLDRLSAQFGAFELHQIGTSALHGNGLGAMVDIALEGGGRGPITQASPQAANLRLSGGVPFSGTAPMAIQARGTADLGHMKSILDRVMEVDEYSLLSGLSVSGTSRFDILAHGNYSSPLLDGRLTLDRGQMILRGYQGAEDVQAEILLKDRTLTISEEKPMGGTLAHGELRTSGSMKWRLGGVDTYTIKTSLANFQLRDVPEGLDLQGSLQATLQGNEDGGVLKGTLRADRLTYHTEVKLADLILRSALSDSGSLTGLDLDDPLDRIRLDLDLELGSPWSFDTNLLKLEGRTEGPFQVVGTLAHPVPKGMTVFQPGGRITNIFPAGDLVVDRGSLTFSESRPLDPLIDLHGGVNSIPGYAVSLDIRGTLSNLTIVPSSIPSLRQDEIVAILINPGNAASVGTAGASSGATQGAITSGLASAGSGLISTLAFAPFQEQLRRTLGLDRVNVAVRSTNQGTTETEVTLGKSLSLFGQRSAFVISHKKSGELAITSGQVEWRFGNLILLLGATKGGSTGLSPSGEIRHTWSPK